MISVAVAQLLVVRPRDGLRLYTLVWLAMICGGSVWLVRDRSQVGDGDTLAPVSSGEQVLSFLAADILVHQILLSYDVFVA